MKRFIHFPLSWLLLAGTAGAMPQEISTERIPQPAELSNAFTGVAKRLQPSVVTITATVGMHATQARRFGRGNDRAEDMNEMLRRFFGNGEKEPSRGFHMGCGVIVDGNGYIVTNQHVIDRADRIQVKLYEDPLDYEAKLIGVDPETDLAVIKIDAGRKLSPAAIGNSDAVQVGEWAIAIGAPLGFETSVTSGIISAKGRDLRAYDPEHPLPRFLQTDAAINEGNSGGPLLNIRGEVVGINSSIITEGDSGFEGLGFAIPINTVARVYNDIIRTGKVSRGAIGVSFNPQAKPELIKAFGVTEGVFVEQVTPGGPAEKAGIKSGDIITSFQGKPLKSGEDLLGRVQEVPVGSTAAVTVMRDGKPLDLQLQMADRARLNRPAEQEAVTPPAGGEREPEAAATPVRFGLSVQELGAAEREQVQDQGGHGILINNVEPGSFAEDIGLREGDIITDMNRQPIPSIGDLKRLQSSLKPGDAVAFRALRNLARGGATWQTLYLAGTVPNK